MLEYAWYKKTGKPPKDFEDYDELTLMALLVGVDKALEDDNPQSLPTQAGQQPRTLGGSKKRQSFEDAIYTGDPVADKWERQIAAGFMPNFED